MQCSHIQHKEKNYIEFGDSQKKMVMGVFSGSFWCEKLLYELFREKNT